jgi:2-isopropylmalate synthase
MKIEVYDTTLRDGAQREGISYSCNDKVRIAIKLDELGVTYIEGGWPGSNPKDIEFFERARDISWKFAKIAAFGSTCRVGGDPGDDANLKAMLEAQTPVCTVVGKSWSLHVSEVLRTNHEENLRLIQDSIAYLRSQGRYIIFDAEHFFDGYAADRLYAIETLQAALRGGAQTLVLCDTNGGALPWVVSSVTQTVRQQLSAPLGIHAHNDGECAVANSLAALTAGAVHVQGTINGYGERCGNANLCSVIPDAELKLSMTCLPDGNLSGLAEISHFVAEVANLAPDEHQAYVGKSAFAHKGGIHVAAMRRDVRSYQHVDPALVGNSPRVVVSELSGRGNLHSKAEQLGLEGAGEDQLVSDVLHQIKILEAQGFSFEAADATVAMLLKRQQPGYQPPFELIDFTVSVGRRQGTGIFAEATVKVKVNGEVLHTAAEGNGPVNALDIALRKALTPIYPALSHYHLADYKVRILDGDNGTAATTRVLIDTHNGTKRWSTVGASSNIIEASWRALADAMEYGITQSEGAE